MNINRIKCYPYWKDLEQIKSLPKTVHVPIVDNSPKGQLINAIFAPDPVTGLPSPDLALVLSNDKNPELAQFVRDALMTPYPDQRVDDPDFALDVTKRVYESREDFYTRVRNKVEELNIDSTLKV